MEKHCTNVLFSLRESKQNKNGETFAPFLLGLADIYNMHSAEEKVDYNTILKGYEILKNTFVAFNK